MMKSRSAACSVLFLVPFAPAPAQTANPHATPEARALIAYLHSISGKYTLAGQHNFPNAISRWTDRAYDLTGKYPALFGQDFGFSGGDDKDSALARPAMIAEAERQWRNGAVVALTWHAVHPTLDEPVNFRDGVQGRISDFEFQELLTPGTDLYQRWCAQVDVVAGYLKRLRDQHIPVLWRPYHEVNGNWFWWGGRKGDKGSAALYRQLFDRFVNYHHLDNLVWVWNVNSPSANAGPYADYFPGAQYVDVLSVDIYGEFKPEYYDGLVSLAAGKPVALGEVGGLPPLAVLASQPGWTWFMDWSDLMEGSNSVDAIKAVYDDPRVLSRDDPRMAKAMAAIRSASAPPDPRPVTPDASESARTLLSLLYQVTGRQTLSGQEAAGRDDPSAGVFAASSKQPEIYAAELGAPGVVEQAEQQFHAGAKVSLAWLPAAPDAGGPAGGNGAGSHLTDFEWSEIVTPGTHLHGHWMAEVDAAAAALRRLRDDGVPVLWRPLPEANGTTYWWAGRRGPNGSAALYRQLFDRLARERALTNLVWVWEADAPSFRPGGPGPLGDFYPGPGVTDVLAMDAAVGDGVRWRRDRELSVLGVGAPVGLVVVGGPPAPAFFAEQTGWSWFLLSPAAASAPVDAPALRALYDDPRIVARGGAGH